VKSLRIGGRKLKTGEKVLEEIKKEETKLSRKNQLKKAQKK